MSEPLRRLLFKESVSYDELLAWLFGFSQQISKANAFKQSLTLGNPWWVKFKELLLLLIPLEGRREPQT